MVRYAQEYQISWDKVHNDSVQLADIILATIRAGKSYNKIVAVTRGGLFPAAILARELNIRYVDTVCIATYHGREQDEAEAILKGIDDSGAGCLIVDDLVDTGKTARIIRKILPEAKMAVIYGKSAGIKYTDHFVQEFPQNTWILFPWDAGTRFKEPLVKG